MSLESVILRAIAQRGQDSVGNAIGKDRSAVSKIIGGTQGIMLSDLEALLVALDLRVVSANVPDISAEELRALRVLARRALEADE